ncbi:MAG: chorismate synthase, partial [Promethearchaeota archaeon]
MAGSIAKQLLKMIGIKIGAYTRSINTIRDDSEYSLSDVFEKTEKNSVRTVDSVLANKMEQRILNVKKENNSVGGVITCIIEGMQPGIGDPMFNSLESMLSAGIFSIPAVRGIEFGLGFKATEITGLQHNDAYIIEKGKISTKTNNSGGIIGGISIGMPIRFNVAIKPTASIGIEQDTINIQKKSKAKLRIEGKHDPCIVPRAVPVVESIVAVVLTDILIGTGKIPQIIQK